MRLTILAAVAALCLPTLASAHVSITPRASTNGATERYLVRIPTEGKVATVAAEMDVPEGVVIETVQSPMGWKHRITRKDDRIASIVWDVNVPAGEYIEVGFVARNPREGARIVWGLRQKFADGTMENWTLDAKGQTRPTAVTQLSPAAPR
jgi:uncharacterized protein YcnI